MATNNVTDIPNVPQSGWGSSPNNSAQGIKDQFLRMLVTQLQNQDPLNPMANAELTSQLAQISTVEGIENLRATMQAISGQLDLSQSMNAVSMIGKGVLVPGSKVLLGDGGGTPTATPFGVDLPEDAAQVTVKILDSAGNVVRTIELGKDEDGTLSPVKAGVIRLDWDGMNDSGMPMAPGAYTVNVSATNADGGKIAAESLTYGEVKSVSYTTEGLRLDLGLAGQISLMDVRQVIGLIS